MAAKILIVEDEKAIADLIYMSLTDAGYKCEKVNDGFEAADLIEEKRYDLVLLDIMLPGCDGYELLDYLKEYETPVIFVTAKADVKDRVKGLKLGADDYLTKPFDIVELLARVETVLRRYNKNETKLEFADVVVDTEAHTVTQNGNNISLTMKEYEILILFLQNKNIALFREKIFEKVWGGEYTGDSRTVDLHVQRMRKKLGWEKRIVPVYKVGYRLEDTDEV
ncbi:MAG: response regulator transcription factor [Lachnospiraceae bacterium]|nr:response regulator transcription factor [Lachnospiraceae bacterium]